MSFFAPKQPKVVDTATEEDAAAAARAERARLSKLKGLGATMLNTQQGSGGVATKQLLGG